MKEVADDHILQRGVRFRETGARLRALSNEIIVHARDSNLWALTSIVGSPGEIPQNHEIYPGWVGGLGGTRNRFGCW